MIRVLSTICLFVCSVCMTNAQKSFHDFKVTNNAGEEVNLSEYKGKKILVVNVASQCGYTPQYEVLQEVYENYEKDDFVIIAFPSNDFGGQEPGTDEEIMTFCKKNYGVTFPVMSKIVVKGEEMHPLYKWLTSKEENGKMDAEVKWNFQKYLIDEEGNWVAMVPTQESPACDQIINWINS